MTKRPYPCAAELVVRPGATNCGSWSSPCEQHVEVECPGQPGSVPCYWYDPISERKTVTAGELLALQNAHNKYARHAAAEAERERVRQSITDLQADVARGSYFDLPVPNVPPLSDEAAALLGAQMAREMEGEHRATCTETDCWCRDGKGSYGEATCGVCGGVFDRDTPGQDVCEPCFRETHDPDARGSEQ